MDMYELDVVAMRHDVRYYLHISPRGNRESIQTRGLIPHKPDVDGNWTPAKVSDAGLEYGLDIPPMSMLAPEPKGVYVVPITDIHDPYYADADDHTYNGAAIPGHEDEPFDHWVIDAIDLPIIKDEGEYGGSETISCSQSSNRTSYS